MNASEKLKEVRKAVGMTQKEFAEYFQIPKRTLEDWEGGKHKMPDYLLRLMIYKLEIEMQMGRLKKAKTNKERREEGL